jgi:membrane protease YdiL (CAAX protease family)
MLPDDPAPNLHAARTILQPALQTWLVFQGLWGLFYLLWSFRADSSPWLELVSYVLTTLGAAAWTTRQAWRDRAANPLFATARRGAIELCLLVGGVGTLALVMVEQRMYGAFVPPLLEVELDVPVTVALVTVAVLPGVFEELMFRGVLLQRFQQVFGWPMAIAVQAMLFAVMHLNPSYVLPHFAFGCIAGFLRMTARALWPCMLMHMAWNGCIVLFAYRVL